MMWGQAWVCTCACVFVCATGNAIQDTTESRLWQAKGGDCAPSPRLVETTGNFQSGESLRCDDTVSWGGCADEKEKGREVSIHTAQIFLALAMRGIQEPRTQTLPHSIYTHLFIYLKTQRRGAG